MLSEKFASIKSDGVEYALPSENKTVAGLTVTEQYRECPGDSVLYDWTYRFTNDSGAPSGMLTEMYGLDYTFPLDADKALVMTTLRGDDWTEESFRKTVFDIAVGDTVERRPAGGRSSDTTAFPYFDLSWEGGCLIVGIGWSGYWKY